MRRFWWPEEKEESKTFYHENGYAVFSGVMLPFVCDWINALYRAVADEDFAPILNHDRKNQAIQDTVMRDRTVVWIIEYLTGSEMVGCQTYFLFKEPGTRYAKQEWVPHQDNSYPQAEPGAYLAVAISLCDQDAESGGLFIYPGTHKLGLLPFDPKVSYREAEGEKPGNEVILPDSVRLSDKTVNGGHPFSARATFSDNTKRDITVYDKMDISLRKGDAMVFSGDLIHGSYANTSQRPRPMVITNYLRKGANMIEGATAKRMRIELR